MPAPHIHLPMGDISSPPRSPTAFKKLRKAATYATILIIHPILTLTLIAVMSALRASILATAGLIPIVIYTYLVTGQISPTGALSSLLAYSTAGALGSLRYALAFAPLSVALALVGAWTHAAQPWRPSRCARFACSVVSPQAGLRADWLRLVCDLIWSPFVFVLGVRTMHEFGLRIPVGDYTGAVLVGIIGGTLGVLGWVIACAGDVRSDIYKSWEEVNGDVDVGEKAKADEKVRLSQLSLRVLIYI